VHVVDFPLHRREARVPRNVVSLQIGFKYAEPSDYARLLPAVAELEDAGLRRTVYEWVVRRARRHGMALEGLDVEGTYFRSRIGENMKRATQAWFAEGVEEGLRQGLEQGLDQGLEQQRALLMRLVTRKFGASASERVGPLLGRITDVAQLAEVGEALLVFATEPELMARVKALVTHETTLSGL